MTIFQGFWGEVKRKHLISMEKEIEEVTGISTISFDNWQAGRFEPSSNNWAGINEVAVKYGYDKPYVL